MRQAIIYNANIKALESNSSLTPDEASLLGFHNALETKIQQAAHTAFKWLALEMKCKYKGARLKFVQIDNGAKLSSGGKIRKWKEGTQPNFPDVMLLASTGCGQYNLTMFVEFKRIGTPSQIKIKAGQEECRQDLEGMGWKAYITNNPIYFKKVICGEIREFFKINTNCTK